MNQQEYYESMINHELLNDIKKGTKCTKYEVQYTTEFRIIIYILRSKHNLTYREIIKYCQSNYGKSASLGYIKTLIQDGEEALNGKAETHKETSEDASFNLNKEETSKNKKFDYFIQNSHNEKDKILKRKSELKFKKKHNDITISELMELWDLTSIGPATADYGMQLLKTQDYINKNNRIAYIL